MDFSKFKTPDWLMVGGGVGFLIFGTFVNWIGNEGAPNFNAFDWFLTGTVPWILIIGAGVIAFLSAGGVIKPGGPPWPIILLAAAALGTLLNLFLVLLGPSADVPGGGSVDLERGIGLWLSFVSAIVVLVGAVLNFTTKGGDFKDLTNMNKLKGSFNKGGTSRPAGGTPPPPPPPASPPPPPPAP